MEPLITINFGEYKIEIHHDEFAGNPTDEFDFYTQKEVEAWQNGNVYGYIIRDNKNNDIDSCWGFYGDVDYCITSAKEMIEYYQQQEKEIDKIIHL